MGSRVNRRDVLVGGAAAGAVLISGSFSPHSGYSFLTDGEARSLSALCDQIIPADDWPSASEAGVVTFIDRQLTGPYRRHRRAYRDGIAAFEKLVQSTSPSPSQQLESAKALQQQNPAFFELVRRHTMEGYYGSPRHGGNKDAVSWRMLGLDEPPLRGRAQYDLTVGPKS